MTIEECYSIIVMMWLLAIPLAYLGTFHLSWPVWAVYLGFKKSEKKPEKRK